MREQKQSTPATTLALTALLLMIGLFVAPQFSWAALCNYQGGLNGFCDSPGITPLAGGPGTSPTFLNGSAVTQTKLGSLHVGLFNSSTCDTLSSDPAKRAGCSLLCLNPVLTESIRGPGNNATCIDSWGEIARAGQFVRRQLLTDPTDPEDPATYGTLPGLLPDQGFATVIGNLAKNQKLSTVVKVNTASTSPVRYAVYATDGGANTRSAAQFSGRTFINKPGTDQELCLNGQCITEWSGAYLFNNPGLIRLQNGNELESSSGHASVTGSVQFLRGLTIGRPAAGSVGVTYGDGQCTSENGETVAGEAGHADPKDCI